MATLNKKSTLKKVIKKSTPKKVVKRKLPILKKITLLKSKLKLRNKSKTKVRIKSRKAPVRKIISDVKKGGVRLRKLSHNPIIKPSLYSWESQATFNPAAFEYNGKVHLVYRAIGDDNSSALGYAGSYDGINIEDRPTYFIYKRFEEFKKTGNKIEYSSGGGWEGGCEDPRLVLIDGVVYMIFTAFDGWSSIRIALTSIKLDDFRKKKWSWKKAVLISPPGEMNKNWVIFPEKINGKFAIMHSFYPEILINYFDNLDEFDGKTFIKSNNTRPVDHAREWDSWFRGVGPSPIKTKEGWLILYHAMDHRNPDRYRMGAILLDLKDPTKILHRSKYPILEPEEDYENNGNKWGVVYSCGAVIKKDNLLVYYGGSDKFVCVASINLNDLLDSLKNDKEIKFKNNKKLIK